jgi:peptidoglycan LD-endopeptidase CwlK
LDEAVEGLTFPDEIRAVLALVNVQYISFDGLVHQGQVVIHRELAPDVREVFAALLQLRFPIARVVPIVAYGWDDDASMLANNSSGFNYRVIMNTDRLSNHSFGCALDINPLQNPYFARNNRVYPAGAIYDPAAPGTLTRNSLAVSLLKSRGWEWGGDWTSPIDYQHFQKLVA